MSLASWPTATALESDDLVLEPLRVDHAEEMAPLLDDSALHTFMGGQPATPEELRQQYEHQVVGRSADGTELWFNWVLRRKDTHEATGFVQASVVVEGGRIVAEVAWVVGRRFQGSGYAHQAAVELVRWLDSTGADRIVAHVHPEHAASNAVAAAAGLHPTDIVVDGEVRWTSGNLGI